MESTSKEIALELLFLEDSGDRMRLLRIPRRSSSADVENLDAALWAMAQMDSDIRRRLREQELIFFNSKLVFQFRGYNSRERDWSVLDKSSTVSIPERTHIKADLKCLPKEQSSSGSVAVVAPPASPVVVAEPAKAPKRKMGMAQYLANKKRKEAEEMQSQSEVVKDATSPVRANVEDKNDQRRREMFEKMFFADDDDEADIDDDESVPLLINDSAANEPVQIHHNNNRQSVTRDSGDDDSDSDDNLMIDTADHDRSADHHDAHMTTTAGDKEEESGGGKNKLESLAENFFRKRQQLSQPDDDRRPKEEDDDGASPVEESNADKEVNALDLDLDNDDVGVEAWQAMLGIGEEDDKGDDGGDGGEAEIVEADKKSGKGEDSDDDLEDGEIRSDSEEDEVEEVKQEPKKRKVVVPQRPRSPKTDEEIREKIRKRMMEGRKKPAAAPGGKAKGGPHPQVAAATTVQSNDQKAKVTSTSSRPKAANQRIPRASQDFSQPPPPLFAEPVRAEFGEGSKGPTKGEVYRAALGLAGKNPVQALGELCTRLRLPPPYYTVADTQLQGGTQNLWKMKVRAGDHYYTADSFSEKKKASQQAAALKCLKSYGIELTEYLKNQ